MYHIFSCMSFEKQIEIIKKTLTYLELLRVGEGVWMTQKMVVYNW